MRVEKPDLFQINSFEMFVNHVNFSKLKSILLTKNLLARAVFCCVIKFESLDLSPSNLRENLKGRRFSIQTVEFLNLVTIKGGGSLKFSYRRAALSFRKLFPKALYIEAVVEINSNFGKAFTKFFDLFNKILIDSITLLIKFRAETREQDTSLFISKDQIELVFT